MTQSATIEPPCGRWQDDITLPASGETWVFAYGSLMWKPGFEAAACERALLYGYHRRFCIVSQVYRGTPENPGLVLGLDRGGRCRGLAYRIAPERTEETLDYLWEREMLNRTYRPRLAPLLLEKDGRRVPGCIFVADRGHEDYCGVLDDDAAAERILTARGVFGTNLDYLVSTVEHLAALGVSDSGLDRLMAAVRRRTTPP